MYSLPYKTVLLLVQSTCETRTTMEAFFSPQLGSAVWFCSCFFCEWSQHLSLVFITELCLSLPSGVIGTAQQWSHTQDCHSLMASECLQTCSLLYPFLHLVKDQRSSESAGETSFSVFCRSSRYRWEPMCWNPPFLFDFSWQVWERSSFEGLVLYISLRHVSIFIPPKKQLFISFPVMCQEEISVYISKHSFCHWYFCKQSLTTVGMFHTEFLSQHLQVHLRLHEETKTD